MAMARAASSDDWTSSLGAGLAGLTSASLASAFGSGLTSGLASAFGSGLCSALATLTSALTTSLALAGSDGSFTSATGGGAIATGCTGFGSGAGLLNLDGSATTSSPLSSVALAATGADDASGAAAAGAGSGALSLDGMRISMSFDSGLGSESSSIGKPIATSKASMIAPTRRRRARFFSGKTGSLSSR